MAVLLAASVACAACGGTVDLTTPSAVVRTTRTWEDSSRATPANGTYSGAPTRTLPTLIWEPRHATARPLLLMAHGFGGAPDTFDAFAGTVAAAGFIVAAPTFPLTRADAPGGHNTAAALQDAANEPGDVSFLISALQAASADPGDPLFGRLDPAHVAVLGHSLGGAVVIGLTRKPCCRDARVQAAILVDPLTAVYGFFGAGTTAGPPTLLLQGTADTTVSYSSVVSFYDSIGAPRFLIGLEGAGHSDAVEGPPGPPAPPRAAAQEATIAFLNAVFYGDAAALTTTLDTLNAAGNPVQADPGSLGS
jgi:alpha-beta hydrolase superfamily lysophospholipase